MKVNIAKLSKRTALTGAIVTPVGLLIDHWVNDEDKQKKQEELKLITQNYENRISELSKELEETKLDLEQADKTRADLQEQLSEVIPTIDWNWAIPRMEQYRRDAKELEGFKKKYNALLKKYNDLSSNFSELMEEMADMAPNQALIAELEDTITDLAEENTRVNEKLLELEKNLTVEKKIVATLDKERSKLEQEIKDVMDEYNLTNNLTNNWTEQIEGWLKDRIEETASLKEALNDALGRLLEKDKQIEELNESLTAVKNWLRIKDKNLETKNKKIAELEKKLKNYQTYDPNNYEENRCWLGVNDANSIPTNVTMTAVACNGWIGRDGKLDPNIIVQLFFDKTKAPRDFQFWLAKYKDPRTTSPT